MLQWKSLTTTKQVAKIAEQSLEKPCLIFKHSTRCTLSMIAKLRLEAEWDFEEGENDIYLLDLLKYSKVSAFVAETFSVYHESPQLLLIRDGECTFEAAKEEINMEELRDSYDFKFG